MSSELTTSDVVLRFLSSIGRPHEAVQYLEAYRAFAPGPFAVVHISEAVMRDAKDAVVADLKFLHELGLHPVVAFGAIAPRGAVKQAETLAGLLAGAVPCRIETAASAPTAARDGQLTLVPLARPHDVEDSSDDHRFGELATLVTELRCAKLVFLGRRSGLQPSEGRVISMIDVPNELEAAQKQLSGAQRSLLRQVARLLEQASHPLTVNVTSPLDLLRELFTVKGAGTLLRRGSRIVAHKQWDTLDKVRLTALVENAFGRTLVGDFCQRPFRTALVADDYRGAALIADTSIGPYLSKFAVTTLARGEGVGRDLWKSVIAEFPRLFWRSRSDNPITSWYREQCDGLQRIMIDDESWTVLWRGLQPSELPVAIHLARHFARDFELPTPPVS